MHPILGNLRSECLFENALQFRRFFWTSCVSSNRRLVTPTVYLLSSGNMGAKPAGNTSSRSPRLRLPSFHTAGEPLLMDQIDASTQIPLTYKCENDAALSKLKML